MAINFCLFSHGRTRAQAAILFWLGCHSAQCCVTAARHEPLRVRCRSIRPGYHSLESRHHSQDTRHRHMDSARLPGPGHRAGGRRACRREEQRRQRGERCGSRAARHCQDGRLLRRLAGDVQVRAAPRAGLERPRCGAAPAWLDRGCACRLRCKRRSSHVARGAVHLIARYQPLELREGPSIDVPRSSAGVSSPAIDTPHELSLAVCHLLLSRVRKLEQQLMSYCEPLSLTRDEMHMQASSSDRPPHQCMRGASRATGWVQFLVCSDISVY